MLRVITGEFKGRKLVTPKGNSFRPTLDRVKESIFNVLGEDIIDRQALDLFCGSGSLGIEAISRGAKTAMFIDNNRANLEYAQKNTVLLGLEKRSAFRLADVFSLSRGRFNSNFDLIFADPPYNNMYGNKICELLIKQEIIAPGGILVLERFKKETIAQEMFKLARQLKFGQTEVDIFIRPDNMIGGF
jgi:16S rRNA (guanine966-N2)-methyltransferase